MRRLLLFAALLIFGSIAPAAQAATLPGPLVESDWLKANLAKVVILDVRADLRSFKTKPLFKTDKKTGKRKLRRVGGHIKGAHLLNYGKIRGTRVIDGVKVTRMALPRAEFEGLMQDVGINKNDAVVIVTKGTSTGNMTIATRIFWQMKYFGHDNLAILNGGMAQWLVDGNETSTAAEASPKGNWVASDERKNLLATSEQVQNASEKGNVTLIDARPMDQYFGVWKKSYVYSPGHIAGAKVFPPSLMMRSKAPVKFLPATEIKKLLVAMSIDPKAPSISYCNSGHLASGSWFVMHEIVGNKNSSLYDGSMHQWTLEKRPTKTLQLY